MPTFIFNKIVRDKMPEKYDELEQEIVARRLMGKELLVQLRNKLVEECEELPITGDNRASIIAEVSDVEQVLKDLKVLLNIKDEDVEAARLEKLVKKGGFSDGIFVEQISLNDDDEWVAYYRAEPEKYPEIK